MQSNQTQITDFIYNNDGNACNAHCGPMRRRAALLQAGFRPVDVCEGVSTSGLYLPYGPLSRMRPCGAPCITCERVAEQMFVRMRMAADELARQNPVAV